MKELVNEVEQSIGVELYNLAKELFPICRSLTGQGVLETLAIVKKHIPISVHSIPSGTMVHDWTIPKEWNIKDAYIVDEEGNKIIDFKKNNLHVVGYSIPVNKTITLSELQEHLYSLPDQPDAIPYVISYYKERWGFCLSHNQRLKLKDGRYKVFIDSELKDGRLNYGEIIIKGNTDEEIFISTYICHPSLANDNVSGIVLATFIAKWILKQPNRRYTYRIIFIPETIGAIAYVSQHLEELKNKVIAGFNLTCVGDEREYSFLPSRKGNTLADKAALNVLQFFCPGFKIYSYIERGSDERQYCSPGVDLPVVSIMRSKYGKYPEYHTHLDNLNLITPNGLEGSYNVLTTVLKVLEVNKKYKTKVLCEPQLGKRGLYPSIGTKNSYLPSTPFNPAIIDILIYMDGDHDLIDISNIIVCPVEIFLPMAEALKKENLIVEV